MQHYRFCCCCGIRHQPLVQLFKLTPVTPTRPLMLMSDGSTDHSKAIVVSEAAHRPQQVVVTNRGRGPGLGVTVLLGVAVRTKGGVQRHTAVFIRASFSPASFALFCHWSHT
jgi:hypothetical protein